MAARKVCHVCFASNSATLKTCWACKADLVPEKRPKVYADLGSALRPHGSMYSSSPPEDISCTRTVDTRHA